MRQQVQCHLCNIKNKYRKKPRKNGKKPLFTLIGVICWEVCRDFAEHLKHALFACGFYQSQSALYWFSLCAIKRQVGQTWKRKPIQELQIRGKYLCLKKYFCPKYLERRKYPRKWLCAYSSFLDICFWLLLESS